MMALVLRRLGRARPTTRTLVCGSNNSWKFSATLARSVLTRCRFRTGPCTATAAFSTA